MDMAAPIADDHHAESKVGTWLRKSWMTPNTCLVVYLCFWGGDREGCQRHIDDPSSQQQNNNTLITDRHVPRAVVARAVPAAPAAVAADQDF